MPLFLHGKNTRTIITVPNATAGTFTANATNGSAILTGIVTAFGLSVGMTVTAGAFSAMVLSTNLNSVILSATYTGSTANAVVFTVTLPSTTGTTNPSIAPTVGFTYDLSQFLNDASVSQSIEASETTTFLTGGAKSYVQGLKDGTITLSGFYDGTPSGLDPILNTAINLAADKSVLVFLDGGNNGVNAPCYLANGVQTKYELKSPVAGVVAADLEVQADGGVWRGYGQYATITNSSGSASTGTLGVVANSAATINGGLLIMGVAQQSGAGNVMLEFQNSTSSGGTYTTLDELTGYGAMAATLQSTVLQYTQLWYSIPSGVTANIYYGFARF